MRTIREVAVDIKREWKNVNYGAAPYLSAMFALNVKGDMYGADDAKSIVLYFLGNAKGFKGDAAKALKAELKAIIK